MYILGIETTGAFASVALTKDGRVIGHVRGNDRFSHLQNLMPQVESVIKENKLSIGDISALAVSCGPGSFTGIRIGVSSARALSQILDIPCASVSSLEALAMRVCESDNLNDIVDKKVLVCPILDARRSQVYGAGYYVNRSGKNIVLEEKIKSNPYTIEEFMAKAEEFDRILLFGDGLDSCREKIMDLRKKVTYEAPEIIRYQDAVSVAALGYEILKKAGGVKYQDIEPEYMRLAEAERKLREQQQKG